jgi:glycosidase
MRVAFSATGMRLFILGFTFLANLTIVCQPSRHVAVPLEDRTTRLPWYVTAAAIHRVTLKPSTKYWKLEHLSLDPATAQIQLAAWKKAGIDAIEVFAPEYGGNSYGGLDAKERYGLDPGIGSMNDFHRMVQQVHALRMHVVTFQNLGYAARDAEQFSKAENDERAGLITNETKMFFWSDRSDALPPAKSDSYFLLRPDLPGYDADKVEFWERSERAGKYFWTRWPGKDANGETTHLPQYNWASQAWPSEATKVVKFWMKAGLDGMVVDAVNWYSGYDWVKNAALIKTFHHYSGDKLLLPEGGGAFHTDDPTGWISEGAWTSVYDYGLDVPWEKQSRPMFDSVNTGNPELFEQALRSYHDRVVAAGGILIQPVLDFNDPGKQRLSEGLLATSGDMLCYCSAMDSIIHPAPGVPELLKLRAKHPALYQNSLRRRIPTSDDKTLYATLRSAADGSERLLVIFNFSSQSTTALVDAGAIHGNHYMDLESSTHLLSSSSILRFALLPYGHRIFRVLP